MELVFVTMLICTILISALLTPCTASLQIQPYNKQPAANNELLQVSVPALPRKLRFTEKVTVVGVQDSASTSIKHKENVLGGKPVFHKEEEEKEEEEEGGDVQVMQGNSRSGTRQEWVEEEEETSSSQLFTMDYSGVRRRRPIHNKSLPVAP